MSGFWTHTNTFYPPFPPVLLGNGKNKIVKNGKKKKHIDVNIFDSYKKRNKTFSKKEKKKEFNPKKKKEKEKNQKKKGGANL